ncbi:hypothetical protein DRN63_05085, partial [Nanoarchaeota archaeon]
MNRKSKRGFELVRVYYGLDKGYIYRFLPSKYTLSLNRHSLLISNGITSLLIRTVGSEITLLRQKTFNSNFSTKEEEEAKRVVYLLHYGKINTIKVGE